MPPLRVYQVNPIEALTATWLAHIINPALEIIKADPAPVEFRPTGQ
jgi:hypothetical protein